MGELNKELSAQKPAPWTSPQVLVPLFLVIHFSADSGSGSSLSYQGPLTLQHFPTSLSIHFMGWSHRNLLGQDGTQPAPGPSHRWQTGAGPLQEILPLQGHRPSLESKQLLWIPGMGFGEWGGMNFTRKDKKPVPSLGIAQSRGWTQQPESKAENVNQDSYWAGLPQWSSS